MVDFVFSGSEVHLDEHDAVCRQDYANDVVWGLACSCQAVSCRLGMYTAITLGCSGR